MICIEQRLELPTKQSISVCPYPPSSLLAQLFELLAHFSCTMQALHVICNSRIQSTCLVLAFVWGTRYVFSLARGIQHVISLT
jgi:hypothetical protein